MRQATSGIYLFSDTHIMPDEERPGFEEFLEAAGQKGSLLIGVGDVYDLARRSFYEITHGLYGSRYHNLLLQAAVRTETHLIEGNHDYGLHKFKRYLPNIDIHTRSLLINTAGKTVCCVHGWREYDLFLAPLAPVYSWIFPLFPKLVVIYDKLFPTPASIKRVDAHRFYRRVVRMHSRAMIDAIKNNMVVVFGHTHWQCVWPIQADPVQEWVMANTGDFVDGAGGVVIDENTGNVKPWEP